MDVTSHSITLISIIVGLELAELLLNLHRLIHAGDRVRWDPLPVICSPPPERPMFPIVLRCFMKRGIAATLDGP